MNFKRITFVVLLLVMSSSFLFAANNSNKKPKQLEKTSDVKTTRLQYVVGFYNLENLFDTIDNPIKRDEEYLPSSKNKWNTKKYDSKLTHMAYAISQFPENLAILGVSEVENIHVMEDLVSQPSLASHNYKCICPEGPDKRGIDVGLIYDPKLFTVSSVTSTPMKSATPDFFTRDQLCVSGELAGEQIHVIVLHWPSRWGGEKKSSHFRAEAAHTTKHICDSLYAIDADARIIIMGDLNDDPTDDSVIKVLGAKAEVKQTGAQELFNPTINIYKSGTGSLAYKNSWNLFDQVMVSHAFLQQGSSTLKWTHSVIFNKSFLKQHSGPYKDSPHRTFSGGAWTDGYSDHFPSLIFLEKIVVQDEK